ncbi:MAG: hypothetical protein H7X92_05035 [Chitinophagales bacterium]|nr:hypothetical protein [Hyphomicrobiales bacterium]
MFFDGVFAASKNFLNLDFAMRGVFFLMPVAIFLVCSCSNPPIQEARRQYFKTVTPEKYKSDADKQTAGRIHEAQCQAKGMQAVATSPGAPAVQEVTVSIPHLTMMDLEGHTSRLHLI